MYRVPQIKSSTEEIYWVVKQSWLSTSEEHIISWNHLELNYILVDVYNILFHLSEVDHFKASKIKIGEKGKI